MCATLGAACLRSKCRLLPWVAEIATAEGQRQDHQVTDNADHQTHQMACQTDGALKRRPMMITRGARVIPPSLLATVFVTLLVSRRGSGVRHCHLSVTDNPETLSKRGVLLTTYILKGMPIELSQASNSYPPSMVQPLECTPRSHRCRHPSRTCSASQFTLKKPSIR